MLSCRRFFIRWLCASQKSTSEGVPHSSWQSCPMHCPSLSFLSSTQLCRGGIAVMTLQAGQLCQVKEASRFLVKIAFGLFGGQNPFGICWYYVPNHLGKTTFAKTNTFGSRHFSPMTCHAAWHRFSKLEHRSPIGPDPQFYLHSSHSMAVMHSEVRRNNTRMHRRINRRSSHLPKEALRHLLLLGIGIPVPLIVG